MDAVAELWLQLGFVGLIIVIFLYLFLGYAKRDSDTNKTLTDINQKIFELFVTEIKVMSQEVCNGKKLSKDISIIQAQIQKQITDHDKYNRESWETLIPALEKLCDTMNGQNPKIKSIQQEINELKKKI